MGAFSPTVKLEVERRLQYREETAANKRMTRREVSCRGALSTYLLRSQNSNTSTNYGSKGIDKGTITITAALVNAL
jgi:hypothetical protein